FMREQFIGACGYRFDVKKDALERHEEIASCLCQFDVALVAIEKLHSDRVLELLNLYRQRGLRHMQLCRRAREAAGARERQKGTNVAEIVNHEPVNSLSFSLITEIRTIQLSNCEDRITFRDVPRPTNCIPFDRTG